MSNTLAPATRTNVRSGSCLCQRVRYEIRGEPLGFLVCHCVNCRKATGSGFMANVFIPHQNFTITQGKDVLTAYTDPETASGVPVNRFFCKYCGSNVYMRSTDWHDDDELVTSSSSKAGGTRKRGSIIVLHVGGIDESAAGSASLHDWVPDRELFPEQKLKWVKEVQVVPKKRLHAATAGSGVIASSNVPLKAKL